MNRNLALLLVPVVLGAALVERHQTYRVSGRDTFQIADRDMRSDTTYDGIETLTIQRTGNKRRYSVKVTYDKADGGQTQPATATFVSLVTPDGRQHDESGNDPDFLTVLNQPFSAQLDQQTLEDVRSLSEPSPFSFQSSMAGTTLHGTLRRIPDGIVAGQRVVGIGFDAAGRIKGGIPEHPDIVLTGTIRMSGRAYYTVSDALLMELDATLEIGGTLTDESASDPVRIVYRRTIRAE